MADAGMADAAMADAAMADAAMAGDTVLLALHGYASNGATFVSAKCKAVSRIFTLAAADGGATLDAKPSMRAWFKFNPAYPLKDRTQQPVWRAHEHVEYVECMPALDKLVALWQKGGHDGVIGFSQGALTAALLVARIEQLGILPHPRIAILCNGFRTPLPSNPDLAWWRDIALGSLRTPALCISGSADPVDTGGQATLLASLFRTSRVHVVAGGSHAMPKEPTDIAAITHLVDELIAPPASSAVTVVTGRETEHEIEAADPLESLGNAALRVDFRLRLTTAATRPPRSQRGIQHPSVALRVRCCVVSDVPRLPAVEAASGRRAAALLRRFGSVRLDGLLPAELTAGLLAHCDALLDETLTRVRDGHVPEGELFAPHLLSGSQHGKRHDLMLDLSKPTSDALRHALARTSSLFSELLGADAQLFELSSVVSTDGTPPQPMHADFPKMEKEDAAVPRAAASPPTNGHAADDASIAEPSCGVRERDDSPPIAIVAFVALHDLTPAMGATNFAIATHTPGFAAQVAHAWSPSSGSPDARATLMRRQAVCAPLLRAGDAVLMDSATWHAGGANMSGERRTLFHFTFARRGLRPGRRKASLLPSLSEKCRLDERESWLHRG